MAGVDRRYMLGWVFQRQVDGLETSWSDFENAFGPWDGRARSKKCAKQTFIKYKKRLEAERKLRKRLSSKTGRAIYYVPDEFKREGELSRMLYSLETASADSLDALDGMLKKMFEEVAGKVTRASLKQVKSWLTKKGYAHLANEIDREPSLWNIRLVLASQPASV
jgi:hypothetical protein